MEPFCLDVKHDSGPPALSVFPALQEMIRGRLDHALEPMPVPVYGFSLQLSPYTTLLDR